MDHIINLKINKEFAANGYKKMTNIEKKDAKSGLIALKNGIWILTKGFLAALLASMAQHGWARSVEGGVHEKGRIVADVSLVKERVSSAAHKPLTPKKKLPMSIENMIQTGQGVRLLSQFDAGSAMTGYVLSASNGERRIFYVTADQKMTFFGLMFDRDLNNLTAIHQQIHMDVDEFLSKE